MSTNSSISCHWLSAGALVAGIQFDKLNVTDIVMQCPSVCQLAFESDDPDIAGQGIMVSYLIQVAATCLIGILLPALTWLLNLLTGSITPLLKKYQTLIFETNGFLTITFLIGAIFHYNNSPSALETCFISDLLNTQLLITIGMLWSQWADTLMNKSSVGWPHICYYIAIFIAQLATLCTIKLQHKTQYVDMAKECHNQHQFINVSTSVAQFSDGTTSIKWLGIGFGIGLGAAFLIPVLLAPWKKLRSKIPSWVKEYGLILLEFLVLVAYVVAIVVNVIPMETVRKLIRQTSVVRGEKLGYGQTTAILIWFPFFFSCLKQTTDHLREPSAVPTATAELEIPPPYTSHSSYAEPGLSPSSLPPVHSR